MTRGEAMEMILHHFEGNREAHLWMPHPYGEEKKTVHHPGEGKLREHLEGRCRIGFFPFAKDDQVKWGVIDIDTGEKKDLEAVCRVLNSLNFQGQYDVEISKQKGWHIWLFCDLIPARKIRRLLLWVLSEAGLDCEIFPKQDEPTITGNGVWSPLCGYWSDRSNGRTWLIDMEGNMLDQERVLEDIRRINESELDDLIDLHGIPEPTMAGGGNHTPAPPVKEEIPDGKRNTYLTSVAGAMRRRAASYEAILAALRTKNAEKCSPPLSESEIGEIAHSVARYEPQQDKNVVAAEAHVQDQQQQHRQYHRVGMAELRKSYVPTRWLVERILAVGSVGLIGGEAGIGKTWLILAMAFAIATGRRWLERFACEQGRALIVLEEEYSSSVLERWDLLCAGLGLSQEESDLLPVEFLIQQGVQVVDGEGNLDGELEKQVREVQPILIVVDPLRRCHSLDENDSLATSKLYYGPPAVDTGA